MTAYHAHLLYPGNELNTIFALYLLIAVVQAYILR